PGAGARAQGQGAGAYNRAAHLARRRELAQEWADLLLEGMPAAREIALGSRR
ncbi:MAG: hypothetical protein ICV73_21720, partial [Acetobacteraceae bacterium]|nr:hypothetical protein [Acetobacteraceae bacterium]